MTTSTEPSDILLTLNSSLDLLESSLQPLLSTPLQSLLDSSDPLHQAKLQVMVAYIVHDLIWISLKTSGVDPNTHPVMQELDRLKTYFDKIKQAEGGPSSPPPEASSSNPRMKIDKAAANRFITAAINSGRKNLTHEDAGTHTRFEAEVDKLLESDEDEEEDEEEVVVVESLEKAAVKDDKKSRRPKMDPFAGYDSPKTVSQKKKKDKDGKRQHTDSDQIGTKVDGDASSTKKAKKLKLKKSA